jgi:hypothetical protein
MRDSAHKQGKGGQSHQCGEHHARNQSRCWLVGDWTRRIRCTSSKRALGTRCKHGGQQEHGWNFYRIEVAVVRNCNESLTRKTLIPDLVSYLSGKVAEAGEGFEGDGVGIIRGAGGRGSVVKMLG